MELFLKILQFLFLGITGVTVVFMYIEWKTQKVLNEKLRLDLLEKQIKDEVDDMSLDDVVKSNNERFRN